jgi:predicted amidophosphoribosyltransferase
MIPGWGPECDLCIPDVHYLLTCPKCAREWDEPPTPGEFKCPSCAEPVSVTWEEDHAWTRDVLGIVTP